MPNLSRRSLVTSAAALPALAIPAVALASTEPDPIFAAIEEHRAGAAAWLAAANKLSLAEDAIPEHAPIPLVVWRNYQIGGPEIDKRREALLAEPNANRKKIEKEYKKAKADERDLIAARERWYEEKGLAGLQAEAERLSEAESDARDLLAEIRPITVIGAAALLDYVPADIHMGAEEWQIGVLTNVAEALRSMAALQS